MDRLPHGFTNLTRRLDRERVEKRYEGPRRWDNALRERLCLRGLAGRLPVPSLLEIDESVPSVVLGAVPGRHGQELIDEGHARVVCRLVGIELRRLQSIAPRQVPGLRGDGAVIVHGDFGPQNMLIDIEHESVTAILDWESAHVGDPVEDLAWAEWIVRMHHAHAVDELDEMFRGAGQYPPWSARHDVMQRQIRDVLAYCDQAGMTTSAADWRRRLAQTEEWPS